MLNDILPIKENSQSKARPAVFPAADSGTGLLPQDLFMRMLALERKRTERSARSFVLMLLDPGRLLKSGNREQGLAKLLGALRSIRDTDIKGWYKGGAVLGVIFTEIGAAVEKSAVHALSTKVTDALYGALSIEEINEISLSFHVFPEDWSDNGQGGPAGSTLRLVLSRGRGRRRISLHVKRLMDIVGSLAALILFLPVLVAISIAIKLTSKGPVLFRQVRLSQYGKKFTFLKFRSMYFENDTSIHEEYVKRFIAGIPEAQSTAQQQYVFKMAADPRVTPVGRFLRKTSLDELPQFLNVLKGDMSLVGPRPPVPYECERYKLWHRQRLLAVKAGITGLWQVAGRSRVKFDDMVRLDIRYARSWSLWLDIKILLQTPRAVLSGSGAC
jgi:lipopolysaccharide/colanic/teichoic acid biosynthesis glycosyltransferase